MRCHTLPHRRGFIFLPSSHFSSSRLSTLITSYLALTRHSKKKAPKCRSFIGFLLFSFFSWFFHSLASFFHVITHSSFQEENQKPPENNFQEENQHPFSGREDKTGMRPLKSCGCFLCLYSRKLYDRNARKLGGY